MKNTLIRISAALLLAFGFATSSQAALITINMTADNSFGGGLCDDASCTDGTGWEELNSGPLDNDSDWRESDSVTIDLGAGTHYFAWFIWNDGEPTDGNPAALLAGIHWDGNTNYSSSAWEVFDCGGDDGDGCSGNFLANATEYGFNGAPNIWTDVNGGAVSGISTNANWIYTANNFADADPHAAIRTSITVVPEPSIIALFGLGLLGLGFARRRKA